MIPPTRRGSAVEPSVDWGTVPDPRPPPPGDGPPDAIATAPSLGDTVGSGDPVASPDGDGPGVVVGPAGGAAPPVGPGVGEAVGLGVGGGGATTTVVLSVAALSDASGSLTGLLTLTASTCGPEPVAAGTA